MARSKRRGTIEPRGPDRWLVRVSLGIDHVTGKWIRASRTVRGNRKAADAALTEMLGKQDKGVALPRGRMTLGAWLEEFATTWSGHLAPRTREAAADALRRYVPEPVAALPLARLLSKTFQDLYNAHLEAGLSPVTIGHLHRLLVTRLNKAVALGLIGLNPVTLVKPPAIKHREYRTLSAPEAKAFLEEAESDRFGALWAVLLLTGMRPEEALGLKWDDLEGGTLRVRRALVRLAKGRWHLMGTKTGTERSIALSATAQRHLQRHRAQQSKVRLLAGAEYQSHGLIFAATFGQPLHWDNIVSRHFWPLIERVAFRVLGEEPAAVVRKGTKRDELGPAFEVRRKAGKDALRRAGLDRMRPYDLRHSAATLLLAAGEHPKVVQEILGHSSIKLTMDTYSHVLPSMQERAAERLEETINRSDDPTRRTTSSA